MVASEQGEDAWDTILESCAADGAYTSLGNYPDAEFIALIDASAAVVSLDRGQTLRWFGARAMKLFISRYPHFFSSHTSTQPFLLTLNDVIHDEVRKLYPGADVPYLGFESRVDGSLAITYRSHRQLCKLAEGFIEGAAGHFGERADLKQESCMLEGDSGCLIVCRFD